MNEVFLGGTCGNNRWREDLVIPALARRAVPEEVLFNPNLGPGEWDERAQAVEDRIKRDCSVMVYYIGDPRDGTGISPYSVVEATMALYDDFERVFVVVDTARVDEHARKALRKILLDWKTRFANAPVTENVMDLVDYIADSYRVS